MALNRGVPDEIKESGNILNKGVAPAVVIIRIAECLPEDVVSLLCRKSQHVADSQRTVDMVVL